MAEKMDLIMAGPADHVLAVVVRRDPTGAVTAEGLVGEKGLPLREPPSGNILVTIPPQHLKVDSVDLRDDVLMSARSFVLDNGLPEPGLTPAGAAVSLNGTQISVTLPYNVPVGGSGETVWVYISGAQQPIVHRVQVMAGNTASEPLPLPSGSYGVLVLAPKVRAEARTINVP